MSTLERKASHLLFEDAATALGGAVASVAREEGIRWLLFSIALPIVGALRKRTRNLGPGAQILVASLVLSMTLWLYSTRESVTDDDLPRSPSDLTSAPPRELEAFRSDEAGGIVRFWREHRGLSTVAVFVLIAALDLSNIGVFIDRADIFAGPFLFVYRRFAPFLRAAWRWLQKGVAAFAAFRAAMRT